MRLALHMFYGMLGCLLALPAMAKDESAEHVITVGTGAVTGVYYPAGGAICRLVNRDRKEHKIRCLVESTGGSMYNLNALRDGEIDFGIVQSDWQDGAYRGTGVFADGPPFKSLRSVFSLHSEMFTLAVGAKSGIKKFADLKGKRVNIGDPGSGMRATMQALMEEYHWTKHAFTAATELRPMEAAQALCSGNIDAMVFTAGHPNGLVQEITGNCGAKLIAVEGKEIDALLKERPYYARTVIPGNMYKGVTQPVNTFGVKATFVTTADVDESVVYAVTKAVFEDFDTFRTLHFVFATLDPKRMVSAGLSAPLHPGAVKYFKEAGLLKDGAEETRSDGESPRDSANDINATLPQPEAAQ